MSEAKLCVLCKYPMTNGGYVRQSGTPKRYIPVDYCINNECVRYGLLTILKLKDKDKPNVKSGGLE